MIMDTTEHAHAAIISITQYESAIYRADLDAACGHLLDTMRHVAAIARLTPAWPGYKLPGRVDNSDRLCMYMRCIDALLGIISIPLHVTFRDPRNHIAWAWVECTRLCEYHGWMPPALPQPEPVPAVVHPLWPAADRARHGPSAAII